jgi:LmbE family N-acetylglucosaminyl deacetylase/SAM-dependent methyltransferase
MPALDVAAHLDAATATDDPWQLGSNVFELRRYAIMLDMMIAHKPDPNVLFENALEVGCAAGIFTQMIYPHCRAMHVIDVMPSFIEKASARLKGCGNITWDVASVTDDFAPGKTFDLIIVAEILCYVAEAAALRRVVERLASMLRPGGVLIFGGAIDAVTKRWGMPGVGAEPTMIEWERVLRETNRAACIGAYWGEDSRIVSYTRDADGAAPGASFPVSPDALIPHEAIEDIPGAKVLVLAAHAGDEVLGCGGALVRHSMAKVPVQVIVATEGSPGGHVDAGGGPDNAVLENEACAAAKVLGYGQPVFWRYPARKLAFGDALVSRILASMEGADLIYAPSLGEIHPDHRILAIAAVEAVRRRPGARIAFYEIGAPQRPNLLLNISPVAHIKHAAMSCFASQMLVRRYDEKIAALNTYRTFTLPRDCSAAEAYLVYSSDDLNADPLKLHRLETERHLAEAQFAQKEITKLRHILRDRETALGSVYGSTSWKITAPLRVARRMLSRRRP